MTAEKPPTDIVTVRPQQGQSVVPGHHGRLYPSLDMSVRDYPTNLDLSTQRGKALMLAAGNPADIEIDASGTVIVCATHFVIMPEQREDPETGEISTFARTVLFEDDGRTFRTTSAHMPHRIAAVLDLFGPDDWAKGIPFLVRLRQSKTPGRHYHDIRLVVD